MTKHSSIDTKGAALLLTKVDPTSPALTITESGDVAIKAGTNFAGSAFDVDTVVEFPLGHPVPGKDYVVVCDNGMLSVEELLSAEMEGRMMGGFHYAPGGIAIARSGGDDIPSINPCSLWDRNFRPACADLRGMALIEMAPGRKFWCDIYLLGVDHPINGTSKFGVTIADGDDQPIDHATGKKSKKLDYATAVAVMAVHGKHLLSFEEFAAAAFGVTEKSATDDEPQTTALDAARTSKYGIMQATGNMWVWGHDGDPDEPRASIFGGSWLIDGYAGSRYARVAFYWPEDSSGDIGARGRSDHMEPA